MTWQWLLGLLGTPWLLAASAASGVAKRHGWGEWKWLFLSLATGPASWLALYVKVRDEKERLGPGRRRRGIPPPMDTF